MTSAGQRIMPNPYWQTFDSPARQLHREMNQLYIDDQENFISQLDRENEQREHAHRQALAAAAAKHEQVRQSVELERRKLEAQIKAEQDRREAETRREIEKQQQEKVERDLEEKRKQAEHAKVLEARKREREEFERSQQEAAERARQERERQEAERRSEEQRRLQLQASQSTQAPAPATAPAAVASFQAPNATPASTTPTRPPPPPFNQTSQPQQIPQPAPQSQRPVHNQVSPWEEEHNAYLDIHQRLKKLRQFMTQEAKTNKPLKEVMGDMRRDMRKSVGQLTEGKNANRTPLGKILGLLRKAINFGGPSVPIPPFFAHLPPGAPQDGQGSALLLYLLNIFSKAIISQWISEAGVSPKAADPIGVVASHIFAHSDFHWQNASLISILLAKMHKTCPILFGIYGPEDTVQGKTRLGWPRDESGWFPRQRFYERMTGLAAGFAALSLRNYEKARYTNPYPEFNYWQAMAKIANTPAQELTQTHFVVLKGMIEHYEGKFIGFYGNAAVAAMRFVLVDLPNRLPESQRGGVAVKGVQALVEVLKRDSKLVL